MAHHAPLPLSPLTLNDRHLRRLPTHTDTHTCNTPSCIYPPSLYQVLLNTGEPAALASNTPLPGSSGLFQWMRSGQILGVGILQASDEPAGG
jgi:hypothetical protein